MHGLPFTAVLHWHSDAPPATNTSAHTSTHTPAAQSLWQLTLDAALTIENLLPCTMWARLLTSKSRYYMREGLFKRASFSVRSYIGSLEFNNA